jgi:hypothetical protein
VIQQFVTMPLSNLVLQALDLVTDKLHDLAAHTWTPGPTSAGKP